MTYWTDNAQRKLDPFWRVLALKHCWDSNPWPQHSQVFPFNSILWPTGDQTWRNISTTLLIVSIKGNINAGGRTHTLRSVFTVTAKLIAMLPTANKNENSCCKTQSLSKDLPLNARVHWHLKNVDQIFKQVLAKNSLSAKNFAIDSKKFWAAPRQTHFLMKWKKL